MMQYGVIVILVVVLYLGLLLLAAWRRERGKNAAPAYEIRATIVGKRCDASYVKGLYAPKSVYGWYVTFQTAHGKVLELSSPEECGGMKIGTTGILVVRGDKCEKFTPDQA